MKDYYRILGIPENCSEADIKKAFRKMAFQHHPDKNPGHEKQSEEKFKEINEAYGVLGDSEKRRNYDAARKGGFFAGQAAGSPGFGYSQQDIFNGIFTNQASFDEISRMFAQAGLRFDRDFLNRVFFSGRGFSFQVFNDNPARDFSGGNTTFRRSQAPPRQPNWLERTLLKIATGIAGFLMRNFLMARPANTPRHALDYYTDLEITPQEAAAAGEKKVTYRRDGIMKTIMVKVPPGVKNGTRIRLKGMGMTAGNKSGDLYLQVKIKS